DADNAVIGQADRVARAEVLDPELTFRLFLDADVVLGDVAVLDDDARSGGVLLERVRATPELDGAGDVLEVLLAGFITDHEPKHGPGPCAKRSPSIAVRRHRYYGTCSGMSLGVVRCLRGRGGARQK